MVCFRNTAGDLEVRAFIIEQDTAALADRKGRTRYDHQRYQVTVAEIEERTGLLFPETVAETNPLYYTPPADPDLRATIHHFPEAREVDDGHEVLGPDGTRTRVADDEVDVFIAAALVNPVGDERSGEWISILNLSTEPVDLAGWTLSDTRRPPRALAGVLGPGEAVRVQPVRPLMLANSRAGVIELYDGAGRRIDRVRYTEAQAKAEGRPAIFAYRETDAYRRPGGPGSA
ncbi:lamin tail domain-containing protein [Roseospira goensis]|uniref:LTD domain-containing protein n=1 Tax=Roseospira goensis TaxID=391922 RepID=A0A7W6S302_9PROT|nr:hypothetical protein [Roseospira goensis]